MSTMIRENRSTAVGTVACVSVCMQSDGKKKEGKRKINLRCKWKRRGNLGQQTEDTKNRWKECVGEGGGGEAGKRRANNWDGCGK